MSRGRTVLLLLVSLAFVAVGIFLLIKGDAGDRVPALSCTAFFGACVLVFLGQLLETPPPAPDRDGVLLIRPNRVQTGALALGGLLMGAACPFIGAMAWADGDLVAGAVGWAGGVFFIACGLIGAWRLVRAKTLFRLDPDGVTNFALNQWRLPWGAIEEIETLTVRGQKFLALRPDPAFEIPAPMAGKLNQAFGFPAFTLTASGTGLKHDAFAEIVLSYWRRDRDGPGRAPSAG